MIFYNRRGMPVAYLYDDMETIYLFNGRPVAYFWRGIIYGFNGHHLGWLDKGWIRDLKGCCVFFTDAATGGPAKPAKRAKPTRLARKTKPSKKARQAKKVRPARKQSWSKLTTEEFFLQ